MPAYSFDGVVPVVDPSAFVHDTAVLIGDVVVGPGCYIGPHASLRGDFGRILIGEGANVQDSCVVHAFPGADTVLEPRSHVGHSATLHGCRIGSYTLVGIGAIILDGAQVGEESLIGAGALVTAGAVIPPRSKVLGAPARVVGTLDEQALGGSAMECSCTSSSRSAACRLSSRPRRWRRSNRIGAAPGGRPGRPNRCT